MCGRRNSSFEVLKYGKCAPSSHRRSKGAKSVKKRARTAGPGACTCLSVLQTSAAIRTVGGPRGVWHGRDATKIPGYLQPTASIEASRLERTTRGWAHGVRFYVRRMNGLQTARPHAVSELCPSCTCLHIGTRWRTPLLWTQLPLALMLAVKLSEPEVTVSLSHSDSTQCIRVLATLAPLHTILSFTWRPFFLSPPILTMSLSLTLLKERGSLKLLGSWAGFTHLIA
ncbi:hypothetical protein C8Q76DRAFT_200571 [Earliella scabrosa]|nr:hypothetical protein C8Q76DRAFT_200571 [Earliella scabrosa]